MDEPLSLRKTVLSEILESTETAQACAVIEGDGKAFFDATCEHGLEGIMAKEKSSPYYPGKRSPSWHKVKRIRECEFVIGGYDFGGKRGELFSSVLLGLYDRNDRLVFVGGVGSGFSQAEARYVHGELQGLVAPDCPFETPPRLNRLVYWCRPELVCRVEYGEFSEGGHVRYPAYLGLRDDEATDGLQDRRRTELAGHATRGLSASPAIRDRYVLAFGDVDS